jgi:hypothetical protein
MKHLWLRFTGTGLAALMTAYKIVREVPAQEYFITRWK